MTAVALWGLVRRFWLAIPCIALLIALMLTRASLADVKHERDAAKSALSETVANFRAAADKRKASDLLNVERVNTEQSTISEEVRDDYAKRIDAIRADFSRRVRDAQASATGSSSSGTDLPVSSPSSPGAVETTCENKLPPRDALIASEQAVQLDSLITWVERQQKVDANGE